MPREGTKYVNSANRGNAQACHWSESIFMELMGEEEHASEKLKAYSE
jgi:hypothetical protein